MNENGGIFQDLLTGEASPKVRVGIEIDIASAAILGLTIFIALVLAMIISKRI